MPVIERPDLVIFDCDGVLVDTEPITLRVMREWLAEHGLPLDDKTVATRFKGVFITAIRRAVEEELGRPIPGFVEGYRERMFGAFLKGVDPIPGAVETLDALDAAGIACCVGSNGPHSKMDASLEAAGLDTRFRRGGSRIFSADDVANPKPAPDLFVYAAGAMAAHPRRCVVIEDSPSGVEAARAAGMACIAYADITPAEVLAEAKPDAVTESMAEVPMLLGLV